MGTVVVRVDMPPAGIEATGDGVSPTDEQMQEERAARQTFLEALEPKLAELASRPPRRAGNIVGIELLGQDEWSALNHYLLVVSTDIGDPAVEWADVLPQGATASVVADGSYETIKRWPERPDPA
jgi:hypothetical protein